VELRAEPLFRIFTLKKLMWFVHTLLHSGKEEKARTHQEPVFFLQECSYISIRGEE
jgi:hypothetical protein